MREIDANGENHRATEYILINFNQNCSSFVSQYLGAMLLYAVQVVAEDWLYTQKAINGRLADSPYL